MAETTQQIPAREEKPVIKPGEITGVGQRQRFNFGESATPENQQPELVIIPEQTEETAVIEQVAQLADITPTTEQIKAYFASQNIEFDGNIETLKDRLKPKEAEPTEEEKLARQRAEEKEMLDVYLSNGGTIEEFGAIRQMANSDVAELSKVAALKELAEAGFNPEEAQSILKTRYLQMELNDLVRDEDNDESEEDFQKRKAYLQKQIDFGAKKLANKSLHIKQKAEGILNGLKSAVQEQHLQKQKEEQFSSKVDEYFNKMPRKLTFELGEHNGKQLDPIQYELDDADLNEVKALLKDLQKRKQFFFNQDGSLNIDTLAPALLREKISRNAVKTGFLEGRHRNTQEWEARFPAHTAYALGVGGASVRNNGVGQIVKAGQKQIVRRPQHTQ